MSNGGNSITKLEFLTDPPFSIVVNGSTPRELAQVIEAANTTDPSHASTTRNLELVIQLQAKRLRERGRDLVPLVLPDLSLPPPNQFVSLRALV